MRRLIPVAALALAACVFELGDVVESSATTGAGGEGAGAPAATTSSAGGSMVTASRTRIDVDTALLTGSHEDFPLLVELEPNNIDYTLAGADGSGIRFYAEDGTTLLAHEVERWVQGDKSHVWVLLPTVAAGSDAVVWMHVGEPSPPGALDPTEVWKAYDAVYHLAEVPPATAFDSTAGARHGNTTSMSAANATESRFGPGFVFDGTDGASPNVLLGSDDVFKPAPGGAMTAEVWLRREPQTDNVGGYLLGMEACCLGWGMAFVPTPLQFRGLLGIGDCCAATGDYHYAQYNMPGGDTDDVWHYAVLVMDRANGVTTSYLDGTPMSTVTHAPNGLPVSGELRLGSNFAGVNGFDGWLDEFRISHRALTADWVAFAHATMTGGATMVGTPEPLP